MGHQQGLTPTRPPAPDGAGGAAARGYWRIGATVTACLVSGRIIVLDAARDRYFALAADGTGDFLEWADCPGSAPPPSLESLVIDPCGSRYAPARLEVPAVAPMDPPVLPKVVPGCNDLARIGRAVRAAARDVRSKPLAEILSRRLAGRRHGGATFAEMVPKLALFRSARPWIPVPRVCLHDCLGLIDWLGADAGVNLVFGVSALPFAAHCWVQADGWIVDDHPESPSRYQPILHF